MLPNWTFSWLTLRMSRRTYSISDCSESGSPGGSIRLVCRGTALPLANLREPVRASAPLRGPLPGVPGVMGGETPPRCGEREAHPQRLPVHFLFLPHRQTLLLRHGATRTSKLQRTRNRAVACTTLVRRQLS